MKKNIGLKILVILIIIAICLISFVGIFVKDKNQMKNIIPDYLLSMNLKGRRAVKLTVDTSTEEITYDSEGNVTTDGVDEEGNLKEGYTKKDEKINKDEALTKENYMAVKEIIEKRLQEYGVGEYILRQNSENGEIVLELPENVHTDKIISNLSYIGKFTIEDSETKEVLLDNSDLKSSSAVYTTTDYGTIVYWKIEFNKEGKKKLEEISKTYISTTDEEGKTSNKTVTLKIDDESLTSTYFGEEITTGILQLSIGEPSVDNETISSYIEETSRLASLLNAGKMPLKYVSGSNTYLSTSTNINVLKIAIFVVIIAVAISLIYLCIRYKLNGIFLSISYIGYIAMLFITFRFTNVMITLESLITIIVLLVVNYILITYILSKVKQRELNIKEIVNKAYIRYTSILIPILLVGIAFSFMTWIPVASIGMVLFWGLVIMFIYNYIVINALLKEE